MIINEPVISHNAWRRTITISGHNSKGNPVSTTVQLDEEHDWDIGEIRCFLNSVTQYINEREESFRDKVHLVDRMLRR